MKKKYWALFLIDNGRVLWSTVRPEEQDFWYGVREARRQSDCASWDGRSPTTIGVYYYVEVEVEE